MIHSKPSLNKTDSFSAPCVIMCRGHSGSRFLAEILIKNGIWLGEGLNKSSDSFLILENLVIPFMNSNDFPLSSMADGRVGGRHARMVEEAFSAFLREYPGGPWGWKLPESIFVVPLIKHRFPRARFIHLIRDGRDVILSEKGLFGLPFRFNGLLGFPLFYLLRSESLEEFRRRLWLYLNRRRFDDYRLKTIFNASQLRSYNGIPLDRRNVLGIKYRLGMLSWINHIETARRYGREIPDDYYEVRYEDLCLNPFRTLEQMFEWLGVGMSEAARDYAQSQAKVGSIGKWRQVALAHRECVDYSQAVEIGSPLLNELGYE